jgi:hypothetical protein
MSSGHGVGYFELLRRRPAFLKLWLAEVSSLAAGGVAARRETPLALSERSASNGRAGTSTRRAASLSATGAERRRQRSTPLSPGPGQSPSHDSGGGAAA